MTELLTTIAAKLEAGTPLTLEEKGRAICEMKGWSFVRDNESQHRYWDRRFVYTAPDHTGEQFWHFVYEDERDDPFANTDDSIKFTRELFPKAFFKLTGPYPEYNNIWECILSAEPQIWGLVRARSKEIPAAMMASCIRAFLVKK